MSLNPEALPARPYKRGLRTIVPGLGRGTRDARFVNDPLVVQNQVLIGAMIKSQGYETLGQVDEAFGWRPGMTGDLVYGRPKVEAQMAANLRLNSRMRSRAFDTWLRMNGRKHTDRFDALRTLPADVVEPESTLPTVTQAGPLRPHPIRRTSPLQDETPSVWNFLSNLRTALSRRLQHR